MASEVLFGYTHVEGFPLCPCRDPGNYISLECPDTSKPLDCVMKCWCGRQGGVAFGSILDRVKFIETKVWRKT